MLWALLWARTLLALLQCCSCLFCWIQAFSFEMVQIPQNGVFWFFWQDPVGSFWHCQPSLASKLSTTERRSIPIYFIMKDPRALLLWFWLQPGPSPTTGQLGSSEPLRALLPILAWTLLGLGLLCLHWILIILSYLWKWFSLPISDLGVGMWLAFVQRDTWENLLGDF